MIYKKPPLEGEEQKALFAWAELSLGKYPDLQWLFHITNEGKRSKAHGADLVRQGLKRVCLTSACPFRVGNTTVCISR